jgi:hypothetical protein
MERPRLRPLEAFPIQENGQPMLALRDPSGLAPEIARLHPTAVAILQLCDGESTRDEICAEFGKRYGRALDRATLDRFLDQLDRALMLDSDHFREHSKTQLESFLRSPTRPAHLAGSSYPSDAAELRRYLDAFFAAVNGPGAPQPKSQPLPRAMVAPHIDFARGGPAYAWAYRALADANETPDVVVVFGTDHLASEQPFILTLKPYDTPLGPMRTSEPLVRALCERLLKRWGQAADVDKLFADEVHHRGEHSIEFQAVWLRHVFSDRDVEFIPILCGSLHEHVNGERALVWLCSASRRWARGRRPAGSPSRARSRETRPLRRPRRRL